MTHNELRRKFSEFFQARGHTRVPSASLVPDDPTVLFTVAGMVQFKPYFLGTVPKPYTRAVSSQKCLRTNDIDNVGFTPRHHTFFEMLGNFSFGDYFKADAITWAWDFLVKVCGLDKEKLWISIYRDDQEAHDIWKQQVGVPEKRIVRRGEDTNFWTMGETGPCGPCTEILYDIGPVPGKPEGGPDEDEDRYLEVWNLVFTQFDRQPGGALEPLPQKNIDTGMGLERLAAVVQGVTTNFDTDLFQPLIQAIAKEALVRYGKDAKTDASLRVIADHIRAGAFLIADGVLPSNEGRGYVLRRILRRAIRHGKLLGLNDPFLHPLVPQVAQVMAEAYPDLQERRDHVRTVIQGEEDRFQHTLDSGLAILNDLIAEMKGAGKTVLPGQQCFRLYDTYGFPLDLTREIALEHKLGVDEAGFQEAMEKQRERARAAWVGSGDRQASPVVRELAGKLGATAFLGYQQLRSEAEVLALIQQERVVERAGPGESVTVVLNQTPFYAEAGGQVADRGELTSAGLRVEITGVQKSPEGLYLHTGQVASGTLEHGQHLIATVRAPERQATARNHTATHLLHASLRQVLGRHVEQSGSEVRPDGFRFDFTHFQALTPLELDRIEDGVNAKILENLPVQVAEMTLEEAKARGAMALFGEKYGDWVRMIQISDFSNELCGGTHAHATGDLGMVRILAESSVAAGVRRIEAVTGDGAYRAARREQRVVRDLADTLHAAAEDLPARVEKLAARVRELEKQLGKLQIKQASKIEDLESRVREIAGIQVYIDTLENATPAALRSAADSVRSRLDSGFILLGSIHEGKAFLAATASGDVVQKGLHAGKIVGEIGKILRGSGGGRPDFGQAGGSAEFLSQAISQAPAILEKWLKADRA